MLKRLFEPLTSLLYPRHCNVCGNLVESLDDGPACAQCWASTKLFADGDPNCSKCGLPLDSAAVSSSTCGLCYASQFDRSLSAGLYEGALKAVVLQMKTEPHLPGAARQALHGTLDRIGPAENTIVVPVPVSKARLLERGFNQAEILADAVAVHSALAIDKHSLVRERHTPMHRAAMDRKAREATVKRSFRVVRPKLIEGREILLVDDLLTSGATASECAAVLKKNGSGKVTVLTLARAV